MPKLRLLGSFTYENAKQKSGEIKFKGKAREQTYAALTEYKLYNQREKF